MNVLRSRLAGSVTRVTVPLVVAAAAVWAFGATAMAAAPTVRSEPSATAGGSVAANGGLAATGPTSSFDIALYQAFNTCLDESVVTQGRYRVLPPDRVYRCLGARGYSAVATALPIAGNQTTRIPTASPFEIDLFLAFLTCVAEAAHPD
ncbi:MAG TPA: hypothetical protein VF163_22380, partial [Micromonosporaceae bacterium]